MYQYSFSLVTAIVLKIAKFVRNLLITRYGWVVKEMFFFIYQPQRY